MYAYVSHTAVSILWFCVDDEYTKLGQVVSRQTNLNALFGQAGGNDLDTRSHDVKQYSDSVTV